MVGSLESKLKKSSEVDISLASKQVTLCSNFNVSQLAHHWQQESEASKKGVADAKAEVSELKKECHKRKKMLIAQQQMLQAGANSYNKVTPTAAHPSCLCVMFTACV